MIQQIMRHLNNFFVSGQSSGHFSISGNVLDVPESGFVYISGSFQHDGVWKICDGLMLDTPSGLPDEDFTVTVYFCSPPADFLQLCEEIRQYEEKNPVGAYQGESFGGYSYNRGSSAGQGWQAAFSARLNPFRRMFSDL